MTFDRTVVLPYYFPQMYLYYKESESFYKHTKTLFGVLFGILLPPYTNLGKNDSFKILTVHMLE